MLYLSEQREFETETEHCTDGLEKSLYLIIITFCWKTKAYEADNKDLNLLENYFFNQKQRTKISSSQGLILYSL